jgi:4'-phosphopantetheinyl transferase
MQDSPPVGAAVRDSRWSVLAEGRSDADARVAVRWRFGEFAGEDALDPPTRSRVARAWIEEIVRSHPDEFGQWRGFGDTSSRGRPRLLDDDCDASISHSGGVLVVAVAQGAKIGVDVELAPFDAFGSRALARRMCHPDELVPLTGMPEPQRRRALARLWTAKEAIVKADGRGLAIDLRGVVPPLGASPSTRISDRPEAHIAILVSDFPVIVPLNLPRPSARSEAPSVPRN